MGLGLGSGVGDGCGGGLGGCGLGNWVLTFRTCSCSYVRIGGSMSLTYWRRGGSGGDSGSSSSGSGLQWFLFGFVVGNFSILFSFRCHSLNGSGRLKEGKRRGDEEDAGSFSRDGPDLTG